MINLYDDCTPIRNVFNGIINVNLMDAINGFVCQRAFGSMLLSVVPSYRQ